MEKIRINVGGIDIGAKKVFTSIEGQPVVSHFTFTEDFYKLRDYLLEHKVESIAMEATGVYWVILYEILEQAGIDVWLVDGRQTRPDKYWAEKQMLRIASGFRNSIAMAC